MRGGLNVEKKKANQTLYRIAPLKVAVIGGDVGGGGFLVSATVAAMFGLKWALKTEMLVSSS